MSRFLRFRWYHTGRIKVTMYWWEGTRLPCVSAMPGDLGVVSGLVREAAEWLRTSKNTISGHNRGPNRTRQRERMLNDLLKG